MGRTTQNDQTIIRYLLNELSAEDKMRFEEAYLEDETLYERLQILEEELIEDYARGDLSERERRHFERHYLVSEKRQTRIEEAKELIHLCSENYPAETSAEDCVADKHLSTRSWLGSFMKQPLLLGFGAAAALLLIMSVGSVIQIFRLQRGLTDVSEERIAIVRRAEEAERQLAREREQLTKEREQGVALREELGDVNSRLSRLEQDLGKSQPAKDQIAFLELAQSVRDVNKQYRAVISSFTRFVELRVILENQEATTPGTYRGVVKTVDEDKEIWRQEGIELKQTTSIKYLVFRVPARRFRTVKRRGFTLTLGVRAAGGKDYEELEGCYFQVIAQ
jgi:hypothetical protein